MTLVRFDTRSGPELATASCAGVGAALAPTAPLSEVVGWAATTIGMSSYVYPWLSRIAAAISTCLVVNVLIWPSASTKSWGNASQRMLGATTASSGSRCPGFDRQVIHSRSMLQ